MNDTDQNMTNSYRHGAYFFLFHVSSLLTCAKNARTLHFTERRCLGVSNWLNLPLFFKFLYQARRKSDHVHVCQRGINFSYYHVFPI